MINPLHKCFWRKLWKQELGFTLLEVVLATFIGGTVVVGSVVVMGTAIRASSSVSGNLDLQQLVQTEIETIQQVPYSESGDYPVISVRCSETQKPPCLPQGVVLTVAATSSGTNYSFPNPDGSFVTNVVQRIDVTAGVTGGASVTMSFFKIDPVP